MWPTWKQWHLHSLPKFVDYLWLLKTAWFANASLNADELRNQKLINLTAEELFFVSTFVVSISLTSSTQPHFIFIFPSIDLILFFFVLNISYSLSKLIYFIVPFFFLYIFISFDEGNDVLPAELLEKAEMPKVVFIGFGLAALLCLLLGNAALFAWFIIRKRSKGLFTFHFSFNFFFVRSFFFCIIFDRLFIERCSRFDEVLLVALRGHPTSEKKKDTHTQKLFSFCLVYSPVESSSLSRDDSWS